MRRLSTPVLSTDGDWVVVQVTEPAYEEDGTVSDLWLVAAAADRVERGAGRP